MSAWKEACQSTSPSTVVVPKGTYLLNEVIIEGPCKAPIGIRVEGTLKAPADPSQFKGDGWLTLNHIDQFTLDGAGTFDGQGATAWARNDCGNNPQCHKSPMVSNLSSFFSCIFLAAGFSPVTSCLVVR